MASVAPAPAAVEPARGSASTFKLSDEDKKTVGLWVAARDLDRGIPSNKPEGRTARVLASIKMVEGGEAYACSPSSSQDVDGVPPDAEESSTSTGCCCVVQ
jgi:hypothetical protein